MRCRRPNCDGVILDDGYCDSCGMAPRRPETGPTEIVRDDVPSAPRKRPRSSPGDTTTTSRHGAGFGLVQMPAIPARDPSAAVLTDPQVAEHRRFCARCHEPVGRSREGAPGRSKGYCAKCGNPFDFTPKLTPGELIAGQYEIAGCLAHGGLGWIYLACDHKIGDFWVVLKGVLNSSDSEALTVALAERRFLAEVTHPNIVKILNFVEHHGDGYIVMEFVNGVNLRDMLRSRADGSGETPSPLPVDQAIAYVLEMLPALGHLHERRLLYCDFKPENIVHTDRSVKLIDLGGVYRMDDETSPIFGTIGFQAPEIAETGPTVASDLYTVGRTLAVLCTDFAGYQHAYRYTLRDPDSVPLYGEFDSLYRFLQRATATDPDDRFGSAAEMGAQLLGVLHEVVAARRGTPTPRASTLFAAPGLVTTTGPAWRALPRLAVDPDDPAASVILSSVSLQPDEVLHTLATQGTPTTETDLWRARALLEVGDADAVEWQLAAIEDREPWEWRTRWYRGLVAIERSDAAGALVHFEAVYRTQPGELAPKLALGFAAELAGDLTTAERWYEIVSRTDPAFVAAVFGLARCRATLGDRDGAVVALERVPETSSSHVDASITCVHLLTSGCGTPPDTASVVRAAALVERLGLDDGQLDRLRAPVLEAAFDIVARAPSSVDGTRVFGVPFADRELRVALESTYRSMARRASTVRERVALVDRANAIRPRSLL